MSKLAQLHQCFFTTRQLLAEGFYRRKINRMLAFGHLQKVRHGLYATPSAPQEWITILATGAQIGCLTACEIYGLWTPRHHSLHLSYRHRPGRYRARLTPKQRKMSSLCRCPSRPGHLIVSLADAIVQVFHCHGLETGMIVLESAVNSRLLSTSDAREILHSLSHRYPQAEHFFSPHSQSGSETRIRLFLQRSRVKVTDQQGISGVGRVDLLVGQSMVIEADSQTYHSSELNVAMDRRRDVTLICKGFIPIRLSYQQIWNDWEHTKDYLRGLWRSRRHLRPPLPLKMA